MPKRPSSRYLNSQLARTREQMQRGATGGIGYGARVGQTISGALGRGAGGQFTRVAGKETIAERNARLRAIMDQIRTVLAGSGTATSGGSSSSPRAVRRLNVLEQLATNRQAMVERIVQGGYASQSQATTFLAFLDGEELSDEQLASLIDADLLDEEGNLTRAGRRLKAAYNRNNLSQAKRAMETKELLLKAEEEAQYRRAIRSAVRGLWNSEFDYDQFFDVMTTAIEHHVPQAWYSGARECGILPTELTQEEKIAIRRNIQYEKQWIDGFAVAIEEGSKANGGLLRPLMARAEIWIGRYQGIRAQAMAMACKNRKLKWVLGEAEHCRSCLKLAGKVKRASYWNERGILPRVHGAWYLECRGFRCRCNLEPTDDPASKGPLPGLP